MQPSDYTIVTVCNREPVEDYYLLKEFCKSLQSAQALVLNSNAFGKWGGLASKPKWLYAAIKSNQIKTDLILFVDCWDLFFAVHPCALPIAYQSFSADLVVSAEKNCFPDSLKQEYDQLNPDALYRYLNSGMIIGKTEAMLTCLEAMDLKNIPDDYFDPIQQINVHPNDQFFWQQIFLQQPVSIKLDYNQHLCQTLHDANEEDFIFHDHGRLIENKHTGYVPMSFHANGSGKTNLVTQKILKHLNLR